VSDSIEILGGRVVYDLLGPESGTPISIVPGGRYGKDVAGLRPLAERLAELGMRVLIWDRPNCGSSDVQFFGPSEADMKADVWAGLVTALGLAPGVIAGGSGGARDAVAAVIRHPEIATKLVAWNVVGGLYGTLSLAYFYCLPSLQVARVGLEPVLELPVWKGLIDANPRNRERILALGLDGFRDVMFRWLDAFVPRPGETLPGVKDREVEGIRVPTLIFRGSKSDIDHPLKISMDLHLLIERSQLADPPWGEDAWQQAVKAHYAGTGHHFDPWPALAPQIHDFATS
jgi:pimeloyl-ACP methyl ester carboxylesterase